MTTTTSMGTANTVNSINVAQLALAMAVAATSFTIPTVSQIYSTTPKTSISPIITTATDNFTRETTLQEKLIGEIRSWNLLDNDWDGENGLKPSEQSIKEAVSFVTLISSEIIPPEPMLLSSGHAALFWNEANLYADIEFLGDGRIAYFIKQNGDKHKGVLEFNSQQMPAVFTALLRS